MRDPWTTQASLILIYVAVSNLPAWTQQEPKPSPNRHMRPCMLSGFQLRRRYAMFRRMFIPEMHEMVPDMSEVPDKSGTYDPNWGYEPYWADGNWVWKKVSVKKSDMCGAKCYPMYKTYGEICGRNKEWKYKTFKNYCALKNEDCEGGRGWRIAYKGGCQGEVRTYPTKSLQIVSNVPIWLSNFTKRYPKLKKKG